ncbi:DUF892 family protein [Brucella pituitosa]|uniref:DUF892 family protein n=1 Tax=Brucella pituitosa TaxID=571256 RepID=UPI0020926F4C|nr:DUF892 family protein [Brucella pituitosa]
MKGSLASYSFENMEIASYRILISAATFLGESDIARLCEPSRRTANGEMAKIISMRRRRCSSTAAYTKAFPSDDPGSAKVRLQVVQPHRVQQACATRGTACMRL